MELTQTQAALLRRGLDRFIKHTAQVLESDARRVIWTLAQLAARDAADSGDMEAMQAASDLAQTAEPPPEYITLAEASTIYGVPHRTLSYHAARGAFDAEKRGKTWYADHHDLVQWISARSEQQKGGATMADWNRYMGKHVTPEEYKANGGTLTTVINDLRQMWGEPGPDHMTEEEISRVAAELAEYAELPDK